MADEIKDLETLTDPAATEAGENENTQAEPAAEEATQLPFALGEDVPAGDSASASTDAPAESDPTTAPAADADLGTSGSETPDAEGLSEVPAADSTPAGDDADKQKGIDSLLPADAPAVSANGQDADAPSATGTDAPALEASTGGANAVTSGSSEMTTPDLAALSEKPAATGTPAAADAPNDLGASDAAAPEADAPAEDPATSTSTGIGGDKASEVAPPEAPKVAEPPAPSPAPSSPGLFDHGTPIRLPDTTVDVSEGYPVAQPGVAPAHPQHFGELVNDGVGDDAGKVTDGPKYPTDKAVEVVDGGKDDGSDDAGAPAITDIPGYEPAKEDDAAGEPPAIPPHVEGKLGKMFDKLAALEAKVSQLVHELLD